jgi:hypothetical protein
VPNEEPVVNEAVAEVEKAEAGAVLARWNTAEFTSKADLQAAVVGYGKRMQKLARDTSMPTERAAAAAANVHAARALLAQIKATSAKQLSAAPLNVNAALDKLAAEQSDAFADEA